MYCYLILYNNTYNKQGADQGVNRLRLRFRVMRYGAVENDMRMFQRSLSG